MTGQTHDSEARARRRESATVFGVHEFPEGARFYILADAEEPSRCAGVDLLLLWPGED